MRNLRLLETTLRYSQGWRRARLQGKSESLLASTVGWLLVLLAGIGWSLVGWLFTGGRASW